MLYLPVGHFLRLRPHLGPGESAELDPVDPARLRLALPLRLHRGAGRTEVLGAAPRPLRPDRTLVAALRSAHRMLSHDRSGAPLLAAAPATSHRRRLVRLAFLAPDIQRAILAGVQPPGLTLARLMEGDLPLSWARQRQMFSLVGIAPGSTAT